MVFLYQRLPFKPFKGFLKSLHGFYKNYYSNQKVTATIDGITYELDPNEMIDSRLLYNGCFEPATCKAINVLCKKGMAVFDIGANVGPHTLRFAKLAGEEGLVVAFEPMSWAFSKLKRNVELNNYNNVVLEKIALSNKNAFDQEVNFACRWPLSGIDKSQLHPLHHGHIMKDRVDILTLDEYVKKKSVSSIDLVKLDVDGYEYKIIQGALEMLKQHKPIIIMELCDYTLKEIGDNVTDLVSQLSSLGYKFYSEEDMKLFYSTDELLNSIPNSSTINVILSINELYVN
jgi:FkbM family methyltransferase